MFISGSNYNHKGINLTNFTYYNTLFDKQLAEWPNQSVEDFWVILRKVFKVIKSQKDGRVWIKHQEARPSGSSKLYTVQKVTFIGEQKSFKLQEQDVLYSPVQDAKVAILTRPLAHDEVMVFPSYKKMWEYYNDNKLTVKVFIEPS